MNITFLIGNGFDLNCGLKTSYRDVYKEYCSTQSDDKLIQRFKQQILEDEETWSDFEVAMSQKMGEFESETDFLRCLRDFKKFLEKYLLRQEKEFDAIVSAGGKQLSDRVKQELGTSIDSFYKGITHDLTNRLGKQFFNAKLSFVSFNYTAILDKILLHHPFAQVNMVFWAVGRAIIKSLFENGILLRGAVTVGDMHIDDVTILGPALLDAYGIEANSCMRRSRAISLCATKIRS